MRNSGKVSRGEFMNRLGIRHEPKNEFERRVALTPEAVAAARRAGARVTVQPSRKRIFPDGAYEAAGAELSADLSDCRLILGVKEVPPKEIVPDACHVFFSHTGKGQPHNLPMLREFLKRKATIVDYEYLVDPAKRRLVFFGKFAGLAGAVDTLHGFGLRLRGLGIESPFERVRQALDYPSADAARFAVAEAGRILAEEPLPESLGPLTVLVAGYGNVGAGCLEILEALPHERVEPKNLPALQNNYARDRAYLCVLREEHMARRIADRGFDLNEYLAHPERYEPVTADLLPHCLLYLNAIFWTPKHPVFVSKARVAELYAAGIRRPMVVGDITCDLDGSVEFTVKSTDPGSPFFTWDPATGGVVDGPDGEGVVVLAVDNLPCEFPRDASESFSRALAKFLPELLAADFHRPLEETGLSATVRDAVICHRGELTPKFGYLQEHLKKKQG